MKKLLSILFLISIWGTSFSQGKFRIGGGGGGNVDSLDASKVKSGKFDTARIPIFVLNLKYPLQGRGKDSILLSSTWLDSPNIRLTTVPNSAGPTLTGPVLNIPIVAAHGATGEIQQSDGTGGFTSQSGFKIYDGGISVGTHKYAGVVFTPTVNNATTGDTIYLGEFIPTALNDHGSANVIRQTFHINLWWMYADSLWNWSMNHGNLPYNANNNNILSFGHDASAGDTAINHAIHFGEDAGYHAYRANHSNFQGDQAGQNCEDCVGTIGLGGKNFFNARHANNSMSLGSNNFMGCTGCAFSGAFGTRAGDSTSAIGALTGGNIWFIGNYITAPATGTSNMLDIGNAVYVTGMFGTTGGTPTATPQTTGALGINTGTPAGALDVVSTTKGMLPPRLTTTQRNAMTGLTAGVHIYCTDCTATDGSTGVDQTYNSSTWKNAW